MIPDGETRRLLSVDTVSATRMALTFKETPFN